MYLGLFLHLPVASHIVKQMTAESAQYITTEGGMCSNTTTV